MHIEITMGHPSILNPQVQYVRVAVEGQPLVLLREAEDGWMYINPKGDFETAPTQREAVEGALGITLHNWEA